MTQPRLADSNFMRIADCTPLERTPRPIKLKAAALIRRLSPVFVAKDDYRLAKR